tara:strand:+ start:412 stop:795 length:384 start_codon:yes stop_codon:yes gene_type:complete
MDKIITLQESEKLGFNADWSIHFDGDAVYDHEAPILENRVGTEWISADLTDGIYKFRHTVPDYLCGNDTDTTLTMENEVLIRNGQVDIASVLTAVDEYIERSGDSDHRFVEMLFANGDGTLSIGLGS